MAKEEMKFFAVEAKSNDLEECKQLADNIIKCQTFAVENFFQFSELLLFSKTFIEWRWWCVTGIMPIFIAFCYFVHVYGKLEGMRSVMMDVEERKKHIKITSQNIQEQDLFKYGMVILGCFCALTLNIWKTFLVWYVVHEVFLKTLGYIKKTFRNNSITGLKQLFSYTKLNHVINIVEQQTHLLIQDNTSKETTKIPKEFFMKIMADILSYALPNSVVLYKISEIIVFLDLEDNLKSVTDSISQQFSSLFLAVQKDIQVLNKIANYLQITHRAIYYDDAIALGIPSGKQQDGFLKQLQEQKCVSLTENKLTIEPGKDEVIEKLLEEKIAQDTCYKGPLASMSEQKHQAHVESQSSVYEYKTPERFYVPRKPGAIADLSRWIHSSASFFGAHVKQVAPLENDMDFGEDGVYHLGDEKGDSITRIHAVEYVKKAPGKQDYFVKLSDKMARSDQIEHLKIFFGKNKKIPLISGHSGGGVILHPGVEYEGKLVHAKIKHAGGYDMELFATRQKLEKNGKNAVLFIMEHAVRHKRPAPGHKRRG